jgi:hypothetical protein
MGKLSRYARRMAMNHLPAMQGEWRKKPYALRDYTPIEEYVPVEGLTKEEGEDILSQLKTELEGLLSYTYSYEEKTSDVEREKHEASLKDAGVSEDEVIEAEVQAVLEDLVERVAWVNCVRIQATSNKQQATSNTQHASRQATSNSHHKLILNILRERLLVGAAAGAFCQGAHTEDW